MPGIGAAGWPEVLDDLRARGLIDAAGAPTGAGTASLPQRTPGKRIAVARALWAAARPLPGTLAERHLRLRGVRRPLSSALRHHPAVPVAVYANAWGRVARPARGHHRPCWRFDGGGAYYPDHNGRWALRLRTSRQDRLCGPAGGRGAAAPARGRPRSREGLEAGRTRPRRPRLKSRPSIASSGSRHPSHARQQIIASWPRSYSVGPGSIAEPAIDDAAFELRYLRFARGTTRRRFVRLSDSSHSNRDSPMPRRSHYVLNMQRSVLIANVPFVPLEHHDGRRVRGSGLFVFARRTGEARVILHMELAGAINLRAGPSHPRWEWALQNGLNELLVCSCFHAAEDRRGRRPRRGLARGCRVLAGPRRGVPLKRPTSRRRRLRAAIRVQQPGAPGRRRSNGSTSSPGSPQPSPPRRSRRSAADSFGAPPRMIRDRPRGGSSRDESSPSAGAEAHQDDPAGRGMIDRCAVAAEKAEMPGCDGPIGAQQIDLIREHGPI